MSDALTDTRSNNPTVVKTFTRVNVNVKVMIPVNFSYYKNVDELGIYTGLETNAGEAVVSVADDEVTLTMNEGHKEQITFNRADLVEALRILNAQGPVYR